MQGRVRRERSARSWSAPWLIAPPRACRGLGERPTSAHSIADPADSLDHCARCRVGLAPVVATGPRSERSLCVTAHREGARPGGQVVRLGQVTFDLPGNASGTTSLITSPLCLSTRREPLAIGPSSCFPPLVSRTTRRYEAESSRARRRSTRRCAAQDGQLRELASAQSSASVSAVTGNRQPTSANPPRSARGGRPRILIPSRLGVVERVGGPLPASRESRWSGKA